MSEIQMALGAAVIAVLYGALVSKSILSLPAGNKKMQEIAGAIQKGASAYLARQYKTIAIVGVVLTILIAQFIDLNTAIGFVVGAVLSGACGFIGMNVSVRANVRTAQAATNGIVPAFDVAFKGGAITGMLVVGLGLLGVAGFYLYLGGTEAENLNPLIGLAFGSSLISIFARLGGGIFTKGADVGADLVGKVEAGIPEDDPRNPGVIADNVGDNVGDIAGMGSDIFESYCGAMIASIAIAATLSNPDLMFLPLWLSASGLFCSIIGIGIVRSQVSRSPAVALRYGTFFSPIIFLIFAGLSVYYSPNIEMNYFYSILTGAVGGILIGLITEYYTGGTTNDSPVGKIAKSGETGPATVIISGLSVGMISVVMPILVIAGIIGVSTYFSGLYGVGIAAVGMLSTVGITMAIDAYGPVADNAGGIAEMSGMKSEVREITDSLDELGNTTAAIGKGFAIGAAALAALAIIAAFTQVTKVELLLSDPRVLVGMFIGGTIPFLVSSITMT